MDQRRAPNPSAGPPLQPPVEASRESSGERRAFHLDALFETVSELSRLTDPKEVMETFVLMSMGALGTAQGLLVAQDRRSGRQHLVLRGLPESDKERLPDAVQSVSAKIHNEGEMLSRQVLVVVINESPEKPGLPEPLRVVVEWYLDEHRFGVLGYGPKVNGSAYDHQDEDFVLQLVTAFMDALASASVNETIRGLNEELQARNTELQGALLASQDIQTRLDRRYFHFKSICDTTRELSGNLHAKTLLSSFLLSVMGTFSAQQGFIVLWDRRDNRIEIVTRGFGDDTSPVFDAQRLDAVFRSLLHPPFVPAQGEKHYQVLTQDELQALELAETSQVGAAFLLDDNWYGLAGIGNSLARSEDDQGERELLPALLQGFLVSLGNALAFETIQKLNSDLLRKNAELRQTLDELQQSRQTISLLEATANRFSSLLRSETLRIKRVSLFDCLALALVSLVLALVFNASSPGGISLLPETWGQPRPDYIDVAWAKLKHESQGALFLDARPTEFYNQSRIVGAENLPLNLFDFVYSMRFAMLDPEKDVVVYGRNISRRYDEQVAAKLKERGMVNVRVMEGGLRQWQRNGLPVEP
ncbi:rhodanese-like domain-containing protein [Desulfonatronum lacustre]|uniref:rhodanese-like domain-containing protein n=1 Tax=Desulfonatronum lacustre TaxID=66849 RepID=UPI0009FE7679|nr:rhodanese-like domain-containing protein [Desulfonatronum lacustre]SMP43092.1 Rhodanese-related sulfurtransferase [Desulfonatronum zhilinae]